MIKKILKSRLSQKTSLSSEDTEKDTIFGLRKTHKIQRRFTLNWRMQTEETVFADIKAISGFRPEEHRCLGQHISKWLFYWMLLGL